MSTPPHLKFSNPVSFSSGGTGREIPGDVQGLMELRADLVLGTMSIRWAECSSVADCMEALARRTRRDYSFTKRKRLQSRSSPGMLVR